MAVNWRVNFHADAKQFCVGVNATGTFGGTDVIVSAGINPFMLNTGTSLRF